MDSIRFFEVRHAIVAHVVGGLIVEAYYAERNSSGRIQDASDVRESVEEALSVARVVLEHLEHLNRLELEKAAKERGECS